MENGKTAFVDCLGNDEVAYGSTEFIVMRSKNGVSPYWIYCLAKDEDFRSYAISSMVGSSGRQRVHSDYLKYYTVNEIDDSRMRLFNRSVHPFFINIKFKSKENALLEKYRVILLSQVSNVEG